jgi:hypothetical protein
MEALILKNNRFITYINNLGSESLGFYFSFILHFILLLFAIGLPNFFEPAPINIPNIIPIEIINVTDVTSIPKEVKEKGGKKVNKAIAETKKFNNSENQEIKKVDIKTKPKIEPKESKNLITPKEDVVIKERIKTPVKLEKETVSKEKTESLPSKKIKPKIKPKIITKSEIVNEKKISDVIAKAQPKPKPEPQFSIASMLKDLRNEQSSQTNEKKEKEKKSENTTDQEKEINKENLQLSISEIDLLRQQLSSCWIAPAGSVIGTGMIIKISAKIRPNRRVYDNSVRIVDTNISKSNKFYGPITESAMRTLLNPECIPLKLPKDKYNLWKNITITFDHSIMQGVQ